MLEHLARAVLVDPDRGVVEDARRRAVHVVAGLLPGLVLADDRAPVLAVRLEVGRALDHVDRRAQLVGACAGLERGRERAAQRASVSLRVREVGEPKASLRVARVLRERLLELLRRRAGVARAREHVGDARRDLLAIGAAALEAVELRDRGLVVVARERAIEIDLGVRVELLDARGDLVGLRGGTVLVEGLEVSVEGGDVVREALREIGERAHPIAVPPEATVEERELLEHLGLARARAAASARSGVDRLGGPVLLGVVDDRHQAARARATGRAASARLRSARARGCPRVLGKGRVGRHERRRHLQRERRRVLRLDERAR